MAQPGSSSDAPAAAGSSQASASLSSVLPWLRSVGIWWDETLVDIRAGCSGTSGPDLGVFAVTDIKENQLLCVIPRSAILSPRTTSLASLLEQERLGGGLALVIAVMYEASLGHDSKWAGYFASLPPREYLPIFWTDAELELLQGTSLHGRTAGDRQDIQDDYETHVVPLMQKHPEAFPQPGRCSLDDFRVAASWVSSRCFFVDSWHGDAMVPLADIFNHKASVVLLGDAWGVAELADPRHEHEHGHEDDHEHDGSGDEDSHEHEHEHDSSEDEAATAEEEEGTGEGEEEEGGEGDGDSEADGSDGPQHEFPVGGMPLIAPGPAAAAGAAAAAAANGSSSDDTGRWVYDGINLRLEIGICSMGPADSRELPPAAGTTAAAAAVAEDAADGSNGAAGSEEQPAKKKRKVQQQQQEGGQHDEGQQQQQQQWPEKRLEIVAASVVPAGAEVHNTYGELGNAQLVAKYGFCLPRNPFDELTLCDTWSGFISGSSEEGSAAAGFKAPAKLKQHVKWLQKNSNLLDEVAEDEDAPDAPQITPGGRLHIMTAAVVRLLGASTAQLQEWQGLEDVLQQQDNNSSDDADDPPAAVPLKAAPTAEAAAADAKAAGKAAGTAAAAAGGAERGGDQAVAQHFEAVAISAHDLAWWGRAGLELLAAAVQQRLARYPASLAADRLALQQQQQQKKAGSGNSSDGAAADAEHAAAVTAALQLRVCEQESLQEVLDAVQQVLGAS